MPSSRAPSNIRAFVQWREPSVYSGEEIECIITFKNVATPLAQDEEQELPTPLGNGNPRERKPSHAPSATHSRRTSVAQIKPPLPRAPSVTGARGRATAPGHRPALSLNVANGVPRGGSQNASQQPRTPHSAIAAKGHGRSLSIMSLGSDVPSEGRTQTVNQGTKRPGRGHGRSASLQVMPKALPQGNAGLGIATMRQPSPLYESITPPAIPEQHGEALPLRPGRRRPGTVSAGNTPQLGKLANAEQSTSPTGLPDFQFPAQPSGPKSPSPRSERPRPPRSPSTMHSAQQRPTSPRPPDGWSGTLSNLNPISRVMSESSTTGTPRSSGEFYSMSNHSDETLTSELPSQYQQNGRLLPKPLHSRQTSRSRQSSYADQAEPETLMMGYAQTMGSFVLDGSLINAAPFEEVKRKGVQGGGGVVGVERSRRTSGMFGAFSWGNIGESLGGLLGTDEMSSMAQMKATAGSKAIPLLSTPQSLLFVDLRLAPGESRSYNYRFALPRGLPPSHRGRAMKVSYHLTLGVQRPGAQGIKSVEVPFRVLGSYNARGETLGHDLMSPYILLQDTARAASIAPNPNSLSALPSFAPKEAKKTVKTPQQGLEDFLRYTERLLDRPKDSNGALLSPTSPSSSPSMSRQQSLVDQQPDSIREAIDFAIMRSNHVNTTGKQKQSDAQSANRFNIARSGQPVAIITLLRPTYRLGEAVIGTIDFTAPSPDSGAPPQVPTYAVLVELESAERVDPSLALRSSNSIYRVTRKVHAAVYENTIFARRISFNLTVPSTASPTFETTGVSLVWTLRVEFTTERQHAQGLGLDGEGIQGDQDMLEDLGSDERGTARIAKEKLFAETFEVAVPLQILAVPTIEGASPESEALYV